MKFEHVIITRYNLGVMSGGFGYRLKIPVAEWMKRRYKLFETWAAPSVAAQTCKNFRWLVLFDPQTPEHRIRQIVNDSPAPIVPLRCPAAMNQHVTAWLYNNVSAPFVLTTRFDTDDALHKDFVKDLQAAARPKKEVLCFENGYWIKGIRTYTSHWFSNPFSSLMEPSVVSRSVTCCNHDDLRKKFPYRKLSNRRWLHVTHGLNISNCWYAGKRIQRRLLYDGFPFLEEESNAR